MTKEWSKYNKLIRISEDKLKIIGELCGKKSKAGKLDEIIDFYLKNKKT